MAARSHVLSSVLFFASVLTISLPAARLSLAAAAFVILLAALHPVKPELVPFARANIPDLCRALCC